jgi:lipopolysaccharide export system protein LptA
MYRRLFRASTLSFFVIASLVLTGHSGVAAEDPPIQVEANHMISVEKNNTVQFSGDVDAKQGNVRIRCDLMTVYYSQADKITGAAENKSQQVEKLTCDGNVEVSKDDWLGSSQSMTYLKKVRQVILTGRAKAWQGQNMVSGDKIIYYIDQGRSEVEGGRPEATLQNKGKSSRVNMTIQQ